MGELLCFNVCSFVEALLSILESCTALPQTAQESPSKLHKKRKTFEAQPWVWGESIFYVCGSWAASSQLGLNTSSQ